MLYRAVQSALLSSVIIISPALRFMLTASLLLLDMHRGSQLPVQFYVYNWSRNGAQNMWLVVHRMVL